MRVTRDDAGWHLRKDRTPLGNPQAKEKGRQGTKDAIQKSEAVCILMKLTTFSRHHIISRLWLPSTNGTVFCPWNLASYEEEKPFLQELLSQANTPKRFPRRKPGGNNPELVWLHRFKGSFYESYFNNRKATERHIWHYKRIAPWTWGTSVGSDMTLAGASPSLLCWANAASPASPQKITWADSTAEWTQAHTCTTRHHLF